MSHPLSMIGLTTSQPLSIIAERLGYPTSYIPIRVGKTYFFVFNELVRMPDFVIKGSETLKELFFECLVKSNAKNLDHFFKAGPEYAEIQRKIQEGIANAPFNEFIKKVALFVEIAGNIVIIVVGLNMVAKL